MTKTTIPEPRYPLTCDACEQGASLGFDFRMVFQPIFDLARREVFAHEALIRGLQGESAGSILAQVNEENRYRFDQVCRVKAIKTAAARGMHSLLSINFLPNAVYRPETCIRATLEAARAHNFPNDKIIFEITEGERLVDPEHLVRIIREYQRLGFKTAIDDFGAGYSGLNLLAEFQPDIVKLDMVLVRNIHQDKTRRAIARGVIQFCEELGIRIIAEGIESAEELRALQDMGVEMFQGFLLARPADDVVLELPGI